MAERLISPGVFTTENDLSFLPQGIAQIGAAFIGPTLKGPAFRPVIVTSPNDFEAQFGATTPDFYTPYAVQNYLKEAELATVVRVLGLTGYAASGSAGVLLRVSGSGGTFPVAYIHPSTTGQSIAIASVSGSPTNFTLVLSSSNGNDTLSGLSIDESSPGYFRKVLGENPKSQYQGYVYAEFPRAYDLAVTASVMLASTGSAAFNAVEFYNTSYTNAQTPWIRTQNLTPSGSNYRRIFRVHTLSDGSAANTDIKISIASIRANASDPVNKYGSFTLLVRRFGDTDAQTQVVEQFDNLTLDPDDANYIARRIGTALPLVETSDAGEVSVYLEGDYPNNSKYIAVEMDADSDSLPTNALPCGFEALAVPVATSNVPAPAYVTTRYSTVNGSTVANNRTFYGFDFSDETGLSYLKAIPLSGSSYSSYSGSAFDLYDDLAPTDLTDINPNASSAIRKFSVPFQGGFDGQNPAVIRAVGNSIENDNTQGFDLSTNVSDGGRAYKRCIDILSNAEAYDISLLVLPGVLYSQHTYVADAAISMCETRGDCFYIMDSETLGASISTAVNAVDPIDSNYVGTYYPWVKILDTATNKNIWVPPSIVMPAVYAFNDRVAAEWFAPAGLNRGGLTEVLQVRKRLTQSERDDLYEGRVNPIAQFPAQGIAVWGQKTLQQRASALDRINVRRLLITVKKFVASSARYLVFEQNVESTRQRFLSIVNPYLASVQERAGLYAFRVIMDETNNTPDLIDRNILVGQLYLQPTRTAEFITLEFNVLPTGATFPE